MAAYCWRGDAQENCPIVACSRPRIVSPCPVEVGATGGNIQRYKGTQDIVNGSVIYHGYPRVAWPPRHKESDADAGDQHQTAMQEWQPRSAHAQNTRPNRHIQVTSPWHQILLQICNTQLSKISTYTISQYLLAFTNLIKPPVLSNKITSPNGPNYFAEWALSTTFWKFVFPEGLANDTWFWLRWDLTIFW